MDTNSKLENIKKILTAAKAQCQKTMQQSNVKKISAIVLPSQPQQLDFNILKKYSSELRQQLHQIYRRCQPTLNQINTLKKRRENVEKLIDTATATIQIKRLAGGLGQNADQIYNNVKIYKEMKDKAVYCEIFINKIEEQLKQTRLKYKQMFDREAKTTNSDRIASYSRLLNILAEQTNNQQVSNIEKLLILYQQTLKKDLMSVQEQLFRIPLIGSTIDSNYQYVFFQCVKEALKTFVSNFKIWKNNVLKLFSTEGVSRLCVHLVKETLNPLLNEIFKRMEKYFQLQKIKLSGKNSILKEKDFLIVEHFSSQFRSISNQLSRFSLYLKESIPSDNLQAREFHNDLDQVMTNEITVNMDNKLIKFMQAYLRHQLNQLVKKSPFTTSLWEMEPNFMRRYESAQSLSDVQEMHEYLDEMFILFEKGIEAACETLNIIVVSGIINYLSNNLIEDSFYIWRELLKKFLPRLTIASNNYQLIIILILNSLYHFPSNFKQFKRMKLPPQLPEKRIQMELEELEHVNVRKSQEMLRETLVQVCQLQYFSNQLETVGYKDLLKGWQRLHQNVFDQFVEVMAEEHALKIKKNLTKRRTFDNLSVMAMEKEIRNHIAFYQSVSRSNVLEKFRIVLLICSVLLLDNDEELNKFIKDGGLSAQQIVQVTEVFQLKKKP